MKNVIALILAQLFPISVDSITARFEQDVQKLKKLAADHHAAAESHTNIALDFLDYADAAHAEADRATRVAARVAALID